MYDKSYCDLIKKIVKEGDKKNTRNGETISIFGETLRIDMRDKNEFPLLNLRKIFYKGVFGELAAFFRGPKNIADFKKYNCNYWHDWSDQIDASLNLDYGNAWINWNNEKINQLNALRKSLKKDPNGRRHIVTGWNPSNLDDLSLPCCHLLYQWHISNGYLNMIWYQRSVDVVIGLPSDVVLAAAWNIMLANDLSLKTGVLLFVFGDTHIYKDHYAAAEKIINRGEMNKYSNATFELNTSTKDFQAFVPNDITISDYAPSDAIKVKVIK